MATRLAARRYPGYPVQSLADTLDAEERIQRDRIQRAQEMHRCAEAIEQRAWARLTEIIDTRTRLEYLRSAAHQGTVGNDEG